MIYTTFDNDGATMHAYTYSSVSEFAHEATTRPRAKRSGKDSEASSARERWDMNLGYEGAISMGLNGGHWQEGAERLNAIDVQGMNDRLDNIADLNVDLGMTGGCVDVGEYLANSPECFMQVHETEQPAPVIRILASASCSADTPAEYMLNRGRAILAVVDSLEKRGYSVELNVHYGFARPGQEGSVQVVTVKQAGEPWNPASVAFALAHTACFRRIAFKAAETADGKGAELTNGGYGRGVVPAIREYYEFNYDVALLDYPGSTDRALSAPDSALTYVLDLINEQAPQLKLAA